MMKRCAIIQIIAWLMLMHNSINHCMTDVNVSAQQIIQRLIFVQNTNHFMTKVDGNSKNYFILLLRLMEIAEIVVWLRLIMVNITNQIKAYY